MFGINIVDATSIDIVYTERGLKLRFSPIPLSLHQATLDGGIVESAFRIFARARYNYEPPPYTEPSTASYVYEPYTPSYSDPASDSNQQQDTAGVVVENDGVSSSSNYASPDVRGSEGSIEGVNGGSCHLCSVENGSSDPTQTPTSPELISTPIPTSYIDPTVTPAWPAPSPIQAEDPSATLRAINDDTPPISPPALTSYDGMTTPNRYEEACLNPQEFIQVGGSVMSIDSSTITGQIAKVVDNYIWDIVPSQINITIPALGIGSQGGIGAFLSGSSSTTLAANWRSGDVAIVGNSSVTSSLGLGEAASVSVPLVGVSLTFNADNLDTGRAHSVSLGGEASLLAGIGADVSASVSVDENNNIVRNPYNNHPYVSIGVSSDLIIAGEGARASIGYSPPALNNAIRLAGCNLSHWKCD